MAEHDDTFDRFLRIAYEHGVRESPIEADHADPVTVPSELARRVLIDARATSSHLLVGRILRAADSRLWSVDDLVRDAGRYGDQVGEFLEQPGDPSRVPPSAIARLVWRAGLAASAWRDLVRQAATSYAGVRTAPPDQLAWGRTSGLSEDERARVLAQLSGSRDSEAAREAGKAFTQRVEEAWTALTTGSTPTEAM